MNCPYCTSKLRRLTSMLVAAGVVVTMVLIGAPGVKAQSSRPAVAGTNARNVCCAAKSSPPDRKHYARARQRTDLFPKGRPALTAVPGTFLRDPVVSNTDPNLTKTEDATDSEPSIAVNPRNPNEIVIAAFSYGDGVYRSTDGGKTWTFTKTYTQPPGRENVPSDQTFAFTRSNLLSGALNTADDNIVTGTTANAGSQGSWHWPLDGSGNAKLTNTKGTTTSDQPWIVTAPQPGNTAHDNIFVAYDDAETDMQVARSAASDPPDFTADVRVGTTSQCCSTNPGPRLAADSRTGYVYAVWQDTTTQNPDGSVNANINLNRTQDGGATWSLNGATTGIVIAHGTSIQGATVDAKFGTVNALIGGVHHVAVDPVTGDVYVVYASGGHNPLSIVRVQFDASGKATVGKPSLITSLHSALPSVAVARNGVIGVEFTSFDKFSADGFPIFSAHLSLSDDHGATWRDQILETFLSPVKDDGSDMQRLLGDYQEIVAVGDTFYGTFTGNGVPFGRPISNTDPIFFRVQLR